MVLTTIPTTMVEFLLDKSIQAMLQSSNKLTTLDVKNYFRNTYNGIYIDQAMVSNFMNDNYKNYNLTYNDNGTYREYYINDVNTDSKYYFSQSDGMIEISGMHDNHLLNALVKKLNERTNLSKSFIKSLLDELKNDDTELSNLFTEYINRNYDY